MIVLPEEVMPKKKTKVAGCDAYIAKPLCYQELVAAIDSLLVKEEPQAP